MKHTTVIDKNNYRVEFVLVDNDNTPIGYKLQAGESLVYDNYEIANVLSGKWTKVRWTGSEWIGEGEHILPLEPTLEEQIEVIDVKLVKLDLLGIRPNTAITAATLRGEELDSEDVDRLKQYDDEKIELRRKRKELVELTSNQDI